MLKQYFREGEVVRVGQVLFAVGEQGEKAREIAEEKIVEATRPQPSAPALVAPISPAPAPSAPPSAGRVLATPATRKFAADMGVDIEKVRGTGPAGRVTIEDVKAYIASGAARQAVPSAVLAAVPHVAEDHGPIERVKISSLRRAVADKMTRSAYTAPHVTHMEEVDVTWLVQVRERAKAEAAEKGVKLTYLPFIIKALIGALREFPQFNARYDAEAQELVIRKYYNIGIAVDTEDGLIVPVIRDADRKDLLTLASEIARLSEEARARRLKLDDMRGGTFTITNIGSIGGVWANPIINYPEVAILGVMKIKERPTIVEKQLENRKILNLVLSFDHRVIDGAVAARFMNAIARRLEDPTLL